MFSQINDEQSRSAFFQFSVHLMLNNTEQREQTRTHAVQPYLSLRELQIVVGILILIQPPNLILCQNKRKLNEKGGVILLTLTVCAAAVADEVDVAEEVDTFQNGSYVVINNQCKNRIS